MNKITYILLIVVFVVSAYAEENSDSFNVKVFDKKMKLTVPKVYTKGTTVLIENKTLSKIICKLQLTDGTVLKRLAILPSASGTYELKLAKYKTVELVPLAPPYETVKLVLGKDSYEIPSK